MTVREKSIAGVAQWYRNTYDRDGRDGTHVGDDLGRPTSYSVEQSPLGQISIDHDDTDESVRLVQTWADLDPSDTEPSFRETQITVYNAYKLLDAADRRGNNDNVVREWEIAGFLRQFDDGRGKAGIEKDGMLSGAELERFQHDYGQYTQAEYTFRTPL